jgi:hypothetical protein
MVVDDGRRDVAVEAVIACLRIAVLHHARQNAHPEMVVSPMSWLEKEKYRRAQCCYVRHCRFKEGRDKVRDHCHGTGRYRGAACQECNLKMKQPKDVKVLAHNMSKFDGHILLQAIARMRHDEEWKDRPVYQYRGKWLLLKDLSFSMIKITKEHGKCFRFGPLTFVDSRSFLNASMEALIGSALIGNSPQQAFPSLCRLHPKAVEMPEKIPLLLRKIPFPYDMMRDRSFFEVPVEQVSVGDFCNTLRVEEGTEETLREFRHICSELGITTMGQYHDVYLQTDVLALRDIVEGFRSRHFDSFNIDPLHFVSSPGAGEAVMLWMLKQRKTRVEMLCELNDGKEL